MGTTPAIRDIQLASGDPNAFLQLGTQQSGQVSQSVPTPQGNNEAYSNFSQQLLGLLKQYQQLGTRPFQEQALNAQQEQVNRTQAPSSLIGASPGLQSSVRAASVGAVQPTVSGGQQSAQTFGEQINSFGNALNNVRSLMQDYQTQQQQLQENMRQNIVFALDTGGSSGLEALLKSNPEAFKVAGFDQKTIEGLIPALKAREAENQKKQQLQDQLLQAQIAATNRSNRSGETGLAGLSVIDSNTDSGVLGIISSKPGDGGYGDAYNAVAQKYGTAIANKYDKVFQQVFTQGVNPQAAYNNLKLELASTQPQSQYQIQTNERILQSVSELLPKVSSSTVGFTAKLSARIPQTQAYNFNSQLDTLKSNIAFGALTAMREASKSGGALGQVSDREGKLLESSLAALDIGQSPAQFKEQLQKIQASIQRWNTAVQNGGNEAPPSDLVKVAKPDGQITQISHGDLQQWLQENPGGYYLGR